MFFVYTKLIDCPTFRGHIMNRIPTASRNVSSMPKIIDKAGFDKKLHIPSKNKEHTAAFVENGVQTFDLPRYVVPHGYKFLKSLNKDQYRLIAESGEGSETVYLVELRFRKDIIFGKTTCTQIKVWRTREPEHRNAIRDLPRTFFQNLLEVHSIVVTDEEQTMDGKGFWADMILWAFSQKYHVYASDGGEMDRPLTLIKDTEDFYNHWDEFCWGFDADVHTHRLVVISKDSLPEQ